MAVTLSIIVVNSDMHINAYDIVRTMSIIVVNDHRHINTFDIGRNYVDRCRK